MVMRKYINIVESSNDIIPGELPRYNTLAKQLNRVNEDGRMIQFINNPSEHVQLAAVRENGRIIRWILKHGITPSITVQRAAVLQNPINALAFMIEFNFPISKMIQWTAAKEIKAWNLSIKKSLLDQLDHDVQEYLKPNAYKTI